MPQPGSSNFAFHDDANGLVIQGLKLEPSRRMPTPEDQQLVRQKVFAAREVEIVDSWGGLGKQRTGRWRLRGGAAGFEGEAKVPGEAARRFLETLAETPVLRGNYEPETVNLDDYPYLSILLGVGAESVAFFTESQGYGHIPWGVRTYTAVFAAPSDQPDRALGVLRPYLGEPADVERVPVPPNKLTSPVLQGDVAKVRALLEAGADPLRGDHVGTPLLLAAGGGTLEMLRVFLKKGASVNALDDSRATPLLAAALAGRLEMVEALLAAGARPDFATRNGFTPLHGAASSGRVEVVERLLRAGVPPDVRTRYGSTPLMHARGIAATKALLRAGANPNAKGSLLTPLSAAAGGQPPDPEVRYGLKSAGDPDSPARVRALLEAGAQVDVGEGILGRTALMQAAGRAAESPEYLEVLRLLLEAGADPNRQSLNGDSALRAVTRDHLREPPGRQEAGTLEAVRLLLDAGATDQPDARGRTLLEEARASGRNTLVDLLRSRR